MGIVRLLLSLLVVGSHFGKLGGPAGGTAVVSFFAISGFLMARTIHENYRGADGVLRFYVNRVVRIVPPFVVVLGLTALLLWARESRPFMTSLQGGTEMPDSEFPPAWPQLILLHVMPFPNYLYAQVYLAPQAWSLVVEGVFYVLAPLLVMLVQRRAAWLWMVTAASLALAVVSATSPAAAQWVRSPVSSLWVFTAGMLAYRAAAAPGWSQAPGARPIAIASLVLVGALGLNLTPVPDQAVFFLAPVLIIVWLVMGGWASRRGGSLDRQIGNLAYGVFIGHFLSALVMLWLNEALYAATGIFGVFGIPAQTEVWWRTCFYLFALLGAAALYHGVERPFERIRSRLRRPPPAATAAAV